MILLAERLDVVLHHQAAADGLDVDGHPLAVRRGGEAGGDVRRRTALVLRSDRLKHQVGMSIFSIGALMMAVKLESTIWLVVMARSPVALCVVAVRETSRPRVVIRVTLSQIDRPFVLQYFGADDRNLLVIDCYGSLAGGAARDPQ